MTKVAASEGTAHPWVQHMRFGAQCFQRGQLKAAHNAFATAVRILPLRAAGWFNLGSVQIQMNDFNSAILSLQRADTLQPNQSLTLQMLGDAQRRLGLIDAATSSYERAVSAERSAAALNRLACALRTGNQFVEAEKLYREAIVKDPEFTMAQVNLATMRLVNGDLEGKRQWLETLRGMPLSPPERAEVESAISVLDEYRRMEPALTLLLESGDGGPLRNAIVNTPRRALSVDERSLSNVYRYATALRAAPTLSPEPARELPADWSWVEGVFMNARAETPEDYHLAVQALRAGSTQDEAIAETAAMIEAVDAARQPDLIMYDPIDAELNLRYWHLLAMRHRDRAGAGHFKSMQVGMSASSNQIPVASSKAAGTLRHFVENIYRDIQPGLQRAALVILTVRDLSPFDGGNERVALIWANRELEEEGLMPMLFTRSNGFAGELQGVLAHARHSGGDVMPMLRLMIRAQQFSATFCQQILGERPAGVPPGGLDMTR